MTEREVIMNVLGRFSNSSLYTTTLPNGNFYVEASITYGHGVSFEFDADGNAVEMEAFD